MKATDVSTSGSDLTKEIKSVTTGESVPSTAPVAGVTNYYKDANCTGAVVTSGWEASTTYYYVTDIGNAEVAIYTAA